MYGTFLLLRYDADAEEYQKFSKIGTGFSDEALQPHRNTLKPFQTSTPHGNVEVGGAKPDVWLEPKVVWEVLTEDLRLSPIYTAAQGLVRVCAILCARGGGLAEGVQCSFATAQGMHGVQVECAHDVARRMNVVVKDCTQYMIQNQYV